MKQPIHTPEAPEAIGTYSPAMRHGRLVFLSGQIPLEPHTMELVEGDITDEIRQVFHNIAALCGAAGGSLDHIVKLTVFLTDMADFPAVNEVMAEYFPQPYPARSAMSVVALPKGARVEVESVLVLDEGD
jgi:reactive intermediate/imine deaminase